MTRTITVDTTKKEGEQRAAFKNAMDDMGVTFTSDSSFERAFARAKEAAGRNGEVRGDRLQAIVDEAETGMEIFQGVADSYR
ncbi:MAG TPA: hypothetical protein VFO17_09370 [Acidimicrobiia bacterium]|jgi:hypothetical protein|nr:hypothetical protein [Acidimicrobiia bacterium]